jgi:mono/diheme cytochrome c family protein
MMHPRNTLATLSVLLAAVLAITSQSSEASGDAANGETLYKSNCFTCHNPSIHTRPDKIIFSKKALRNRVEFCEGNAGLSWTSQQIDDVAEYLNQTYYKYDD